MRPVYDENHIMVLDDVLSPELCDAIVAKYQEDPRKTDALSKTLYNRPYREGKCLTISRHEDWFDLDTQVFKAVQQATQIYAARHQIETDFRDIGYTVADFEPGRVTQEHIDHIHGQSVFRLITMVLYLNEPGEGGETYFVEQKQKVKPKKGRAVMFPPFYTHRHGSLAASENRYILVTWMCSDPAKYNPAMGLQ